MDINEMNEKIDFAMDKIVSYEGNIEELPKYLLTIDFAIKNLYVQTIYGKASIHPQIEFGTIMFIYINYSGKEFLKHLEFERISNVSKNQEDKERYINLKRNNELLTIYDKSQLILPENLNAWKEYLLKREAENKLTDEEELELFKFRQEEQKKTRKFNAIKNLFTDKLVNGLSITDKEKKDMLDYLSTLETNNTPILLKKLPASAPALVAEIPSDPVNTVIKPKVEKIKSTENEHVLLGNIEGAQSFMINKKTVTLDEIAKALTPKSTEEDFVSDNQEIISKYGDLGKYLDTTERIARSLGYRIMFEDAKDPITQEEPGLIYAYTWMAGSAESIFKDFTIDLKGVLFDNRIKFFPFIIKVPDPSGQCYENFGAYSFTRPKEEFTVEGKSFIRDFLTCGARALPEKGYYSIDEIRLHSVVDMKTLPNMDKDSRNDVKNRLIAANDIANRNGSGMNVFEYALSLAPFSRFKFKEFNRETREFELTNENVSPRLFISPMNTSIVNIKFSQDQVDVYKLN